MFIKYVWAKILKKIRCAAIINSTIHKTSKIESGSHIVNSSMGKHSFCGYDCEIIDSEIGSFCSLASNVIIGGAMHPTDWVSTSPVFYSGKDSISTKFSEHQRPNHKRTIIEHDVWIGTGAIIKQGVYIGTGAVIGMGSVITKNVEPYSIVAGNPGKVIKKRFDDSTCEKLLNSNWWLLDDSQLKKQAIYFNKTQFFLNQNKI